MYAWMRENATEERKPKDTEEQFIYKARKKAIGPFKQRMWSLGDEARARDRPVARGAVHVPDEAAEDRRHRRRSCRAFVKVPQIRARSRRGDRRRRRQDHRGGEEGRRARRLTVSGRDHEDLHDSTKKNTIASSCFVRRGRVASRRAACATHHTTDRPRPAASIVPAPPSPSRTTRFPGFMDAMAMPFDLKGRRAARRARPPAIACSFRLAVKRRPLVGRPRRGRLRGAGRRRPAADAGRAGAGAGRRADARLRADRSGRQRRSRCRR